MAEDPNTGFKEKLKQTILTDAGRHIFVSVGDGEGTLVYTRAILSSQKPVNSSGQALDDEAIRQITSLPDDLKEGQLTLTPVTDDHFDVIADFNNKNQPADINFSCIGWYARVDSTNEQNQKVQGDEALIAITFTTNDHETLAAGSPDGLSTDVISAQLSMTIAEAANIDMTVNEVGYVTRAELNAWQTKVTADLNGKIEGKADKTDLDKEIKAVTDLANTKANTVDVDSKIKTVTDLANTKANSADVYTKNETDNQINKFDLSKVKFRKQFLNADGDKADKTWSATKNDDGTYTIDLYNDDWTAAKLADVLAQLPNKVDTSTVNAQIADVKNTIKSNVDNLQSAINTKANASDVYTKKQVDDAFSSRDATIANKADKSYVDDKVDAIDFSKIKFRKQYVTGNNKTADSTWQATKNADGTYTIDLYSDDWTAQRVVDLLNQIGSKANASDVNSLRNLINQQNETIQSLTTRLNNAENEIRYIKANYVEGRTFPASQEAQANSWENENPQRIAFIER